MSKACKIMYLVILQLYPGDKHRIEPLHEGLNPLKHPRNYSNTACSFTRV